MLRDFLKSFLKSFFIVLFISAPLFFIFAKPVSALEFGKFYDLYTPAILYTGVYGKGVNECVPEGSCYEQIISLDCNDVGTSCGHHQTCTTGNECAKAWHTDAICIDTNYEYGSSGSILNDYTSKCTNPEHYGIQFVRPYCGVLQFIRNCYFPSLPVTCSIFQRLMECKINTTIYKCDVEFADPMNGDWVELIDCAPTPPPPTPTPTPDPCSVINTFPVCPFAALPYTCNFQAGAKCKILNTVYICNYGFFTGWDWGLLKVCPPTTTLTPTPPPNPCTTESAASRTLDIGGTDAIWAKVSSGLGSRTITQINFTSNKVSIASVSPAYDTTASPTDGLYRTSVTGNANGTATVTSQAVLSDGTKCSSDTTNVTVGSTPTPTPALYSIEGIIFDDVNENGRKDTGEVGYTGTGRVEWAAGSVNIPPSDFMVPSLLAGTHILSFSISNPTYKFTYPASGSIALTVGSCTPVLGHYGCSGGSIVGLNVGVTNLKNPWFQSRGLDMRWDLLPGIFTDRMPSGSYASIPGIGGMPGVMFAGTTFSFGDGNASALNWQVGGDTYSSTHSVIPTAYDFLYQTAGNSGTAPTSLGNTLDSGVASGMSGGVYATGDLAVNDTSTVTFGSGKNYIILVDGNLNIRTNITVPVGSTVIFSASGNISIDANVGNIQGAYSADEDFTIETAASCPAGTADTQLIIEGQAVVNAGRQGGSFINRRNLCAGNNVNPSVLFEERPDFILNYPSLTKQNRRVWQEIAP